VDGSDNILINPVAERLLLAAFVQGKAEEPDLDLYTNEPGGECRRVLADVLRRHGRPQSPEALQLWLQAEEVSFPDAHVLFSLQVPGDVAQIDLGLRELSVRRRCEIGADKIAGLGIQGADDLEASIQEIATDVVAPLVRAKREDETANALDWARAHIDGEASGIAGYRSLWSPLFADLVGPLGQSIFMFVAGPPGVGKSVWCAMQMLDTARQGGVSVYCSPDMQNRRSLMRFASAISGIPYTKVWRHEPPKRSLLTPMEKQRVNAALDEIENLPLIFSGNASMPEFCSLCRREGADAATFDFVQKATIPGIPFTEMERTVSLSVNMLRDLTDQCFTLGVSHEKPEVGTGDPQLIFPWSSEPQKLLDIAAFFRRVNETPIVNLITKKNRDGPNGTIPYYFYKPLMRMFELPVKQNGISIEL